MALAKDAFLISVFEKWRAALDDPRLPTFMALHEVRGRLGEEEFKRLSGLAFHAAANALTSELTTWQRLKAYTTSAGTELSTRILMRAFDVLLVAGITDQETRDGILTGRLEPREVASGLRSKDRAGYEVLEFLRLTA